MGTIKALRKKWKDSATIGFIIIIGLDRQENLDEMAEEIGEEVYFDAEGGVIKKLGGRGVPHWFVLNSDNKILRHFGGYYPSPDEQIKQLGL